MHTLERRREQLKGHKCCVTLCAHFTLLLITGIWFFYLIIGSVIFVAIEREESDIKREQIKEDFKVLLTEFVEQIQYNASDNNNTIPEDALAELETALYRTLGLHPNDFIHWDFLGGVHYCLSVISTIGYGHYVPTSQLGRGLTMLYALFGIPLNLIFLARVGTHLSRLIAFTYYQLSCFVDRSHERRSDVTSLSSATTSTQTSLSEQTNDSSQRDDIYIRSQNSSTKTNIHVIELDYRERNVQNDHSNHANHVNQEHRRHNSDSASEISKLETGYTSLPENFKVPILYVILLYFMYNTAGASLIWYREKYWTFLDSFYYAFISLSTIGFGDLLPNSFTSDDQLERIVGDMLLIIYISLGMALLSASFTILIDRADGFNKKGKDKEEDKPKSTSQSCTQKLTTISM